MQYSVFFIYNIKMYRTEQKKRGTLFIYWFFTIIYMAIIFYLSSQKWPEVLGGFEISDKLIHTLVYIPLAFLLYNSLVKSGIRKYAFVFAFLLTTIYGISDELHQAFVPGREASLFDFFADSFGGFLGSLLASVIKK